MLRIRLARGGRKNRPFYKIVLAESKSPRDGLFRESLGYFNPSAASHETSLSIALDRLDYWVERGAQPSDRVKQLRKQFLKKQAREQLS
jgi:small subunit ribosomal protein S16